MRTPSEIAAEARTLIDNASRMFVPAPIVTLVELQVEFMESVVAALEPAPAPAAKPAKS